MLETQMNARIARICEECSASMAELDAMMASKETMVHLAPKGVSPEQAQQYMGEVVSSMKRTRDLLKDSQRNLTDLHCKEPRNG